MQTADKSKEYYVHYNKKIPTFMHQRTASKNMIKYQNTNLMSVLQHTDTKTNDRGSKLTVQMRIQPLY